MRHVHLLLWCISELTVVFIKDVKPLASFCLKSFSWSSDVFNYSYVFSHPQRLRGYVVISSQGERAPVFGIL